MLQPERKNRKPNKKTKNENKKRKQKNKNGRKSDAQSLQNAQALHTLSIAQRVYSRYVQSLDTPQRDCNINYISMIVKDLQHSSGTYQAVIKTQCVQ